MDATKAVLNALYDALRNDPDLAALMGAGWEGPYHRTPVDAAWPFLTHKLESNAGLDNATRPATYSVEVWDYGETTDRIWSIRARLIALLDLATLRVPSQGAARTWFETEAWMPNEDRFVSTIRLVFTARYARAGEITAITQQKGS